MNENGKFKVLIFWRYHGNGMWDWRLCLSL